MATPVLSPDAPPPHDDLEAPPGDTAANGRVPAKPAPATPQDSGFTTGGFTTLDDVPPPEPPRSSPGTTLWLRILLGFVAAYFIYCFGLWNGTHSSRPSDQGSFTAPPTTPLPGRVKVHVAGRVRRPGLYSLPYDARVQDAIHQAGGPLPDADVDALNLAAWVDDGSRIEVPGKAKLVPDAPVPSSHVTHSAPPEAAPRMAQAGPSPMRHSLTPPPQRSAAPVAAVAATSKLGTKVAGGRGKSQKPTAEYLSRHPVDINHAGADDLQSLPGVGPVMAAKILAQREQYGRFRTVDDLREVKGIGEKRLEKLRPLVVVK